jgi:hypothetical protein
MNPLKDLFTKAIKNLSVEEQKELASHLEKFNVAPVAAAPAVAAPVQMGGEGKLADGTVVKYDTPTPVVGSTVTVVTPEGELPAPDGEHTLDDGTKIETVGGKVTAVEAPEMPVAETPAPVAQAAPVVPSVFEKEVKENFASVKAENETLKTELSKMNEVIANQSKDIEAIKSFFNSLMEVPTAKPVETESVFNKKLKNLHSFTK